MIRVDRDAPNFGREIASHVRHRVNLAHTELQEGDRRQSRADTGVLCPSEELDAAISDESKAVSSNSAPTITSSQHVTRTRYEAVAEMAIPSKVLLSSELSTASSTATAVLGNVTRVEAPPAADSAPHLLKIQVKGADHVTLANKFPKEDSTFIRKLALESDEFSCGRTLSDLVASTSVHVSEQSVQSKNATAEGRATRLSWDVVVHEGVAAEFESRWTEVYRRTLFKDPEEHSMI